MRVYRIKAGCLRMEVVELLRARTKFSFLGTQSTAKGSIIQAFTLSTQYQFLSERGQ